MTRCEKMMRCRALYIWQRDWISQYLHHTTCLLFLIGVLLYHVAASVILNLNSSHQHVSAYKVFKGFYLFFLLFYFNFMHHTYVGPIILQRKYQANHIQWLIMLLMLLVRCYYCMQCPVFYKPPLTVVHNTCCFSAQKYHKTQQKSASHSF